MFAKQDLRYQGYGVMKLRSAPRPGEHILGFQSSSGIAWPVVREVSPLTHSLFPIKVRSRGLQRCSYAQNRFA